jgi:hypothetical protein
MTRLVLSELENRNYCSTKFSRYTLYSHFLHICWLTYDSDHLRATFKSLDCNIDNHFSTYRIITYWKNTYKLSKKIQTWLVSAPNHKSTSTEYTNKSVVKNGFIGRNCRPQILSSEKKKS